MGKADLLFDWFGFDETSKLMLIEHKQTAESKQNK